MIPENSNTSAHIGLVQLILRYMSKLGIESAEVFRLAGISSDELNSLEDRVPSKMFPAIWESALKLSEDPDFGLHMGIEMAESYFRGNFIFYIMMNCPTLKKAIESFIRYHQIFENASQHQLTIKQDLAYFSWKFGIKVYKNPRHNYETQICTSALLLSRITDNNLQFKKIHFRHPRPDDISEHERIFKAPLVFDQPENQLVFEKKYLETEIAQASSDLLDTLLQFGEKALKHWKLPQSYSEKVIQELIKMLAQGDHPGIEGVAKALGLGIRNLQIKLKNEGKTYQELFDGLRKEIAQKYLMKPDVPICDVTFLLGFSEQSAFNHAFKRWTGYTPMEFRSSSLN